MLANSLFKQILFCAVLGLGRIMTCEAQQLSPRDTLHHRITVSLQLTRQHYEIFPAGIMPTKAYLAPLQVAVGYQLRPKLGLQVGFARRHKRYEFLNRGTTTSGIPTTDNLVFESWVTALPVRGRLTLTKRPAQRFQVDGLAGLCLVTYRDYFERTVAEDGQVKDYRSDRARANSIYVSFGAGTRYALGKRRRLEVTADYLLNKITEPANNATHQFLDAPLGLTGALDVGMRYRL